jgi:hypothetical protein
MTLRTMSLADVDAAEPETSDLIDTRRDSLKMIRVNAGGYAAEVITFPTIRDFPFQPDVRNDMGFILTVFH